MAGETTVRYPSGMAPDEAAVSRPVLAAAFLGLLILYFGQLGGFPLQDPDEGRYSEIAREMVESGDWVTPHLNYVSYFHKPPLLYWGTALSLAVFGETEFAARFPTALTGVLSVLFTFLLGRRMFGERAALLGAGLLATTPLFFVISQVVLIDMFLTACLTGALGCVYAAHQHPERRHAWACATALCLGLGFLAKGPIIVLLAGAIAAGFLLWQRDGASALALLGWRPILVFLAVVSPWLVLVSVRNPDFLDVFFYDHHIRRFLGDVGHKEDGLFYFAPVLFFGAAPWTFLAVLTALRREGRSAWANVPADPSRLLFLWAGVIIVFFSLSSTKLPTYVVPAFPPLSLLLGAWLDRAIAADPSADTPLRWIARAMGATSIVLLGCAAFAFLFADWLADALRVDVVDVRTLLFPVAGGGAVLGLTGVVLGLRREPFEMTPARASAALIATMAFALFLGITGRAVAKNSRDLADAIRAELQPGDLVVSFDHIMHGLPFYLGQRVVHAGDPGELAPGLARDEAHLEFFWPTEQLVERWQSGEPTFVATDVRHLYQLPDDLSPEPRVVARDLNRVVLSNTN